MSVDSTLVLGDSSVLWEKSEIYLGWVPTLFLAMVVGTMCLATLLTLGHSALLVSEIHGVVFLFLPAVTAPAAVLQLAAILIRLCIFFRFPGLALVFAIIEQVRFSAEILPVVRINTRVSLMVFVTEGTPDRLEVKHIEVCVVLHLVQHVN
jgi:hypothetical protein